LATKNRIFSHKEQEKQEMFPSSCLLLIFVADIILKLTND